MRLFHLMFAAFASLGLLAGSAADASADHGGYGFGGRGCGGYERGGFRCGGYSGGPFDGFRNGGYGYDGRERGYVGRGYGYGGEEFGCRGNCGRNELRGREMRGSVGRFDRRGRAPQPGLNRLDEPRSPRGPSNENLAPPAPGRVPVGRIQNVQPTPKPIVIPEKMKGIGLLPKADQAAALAQKTCPVTKGLLGGHGKPIKVLVQGRAIFVCCAGCVEDIKANPKEFLKVRP